ncbi:MAG: S8 family serine peptidase [bacterium]|jgi:serine protease AprX
MKGLLTLLLLYICGLTQAQYTKYIFEFTDKKGSSYSLSNPGDFLSQESIDRKNRYNIKIDSTDLPVSNIYLDSIKNAGKVDIINTSKWLNQVLISTTDEAAIVKITQFPFVKRRVPLSSKPSRIKTDKIHENIQGLSTEEKAVEAFENVINYGNTSTQVKIHEGDFLHDKGFLGKGMKIAVFDGGFLRYQTNVAFDSLRRNGQIKMTWDFVARNSSVNEDNYHGAYCLSILAANLPGTYVGTAPQASYYLFRTEDVGSEYPIEEQYWIAAAEMADSIGVDMISSSLGYSTFDDASLNHRYENLNGKTTLITRAASIAAQKGILVMTSAGNEGTSEWKYIAAPADAEGVLSVGAVNINKEVAGFSSYGPTYDGRIKPEIASVGWSTYLINSLGRVIRSDGTSYSTPNIAGLIACLWQAFPEFSSKEIIEIVKKSADRFTTPDVRTGYGLPNMRLAYEALTRERENKKMKLLLKSERIKVYPTPFRNYFTILYSPQSTGKLEIQLFTLDGRWIRNRSFEVRENELYSFTLDDLGSLSSGNYLLKYRDTEGEGIIRLLK